MSVRSSQVLAVIPARGGSKGVPRKNVQLVGGKPMIVHTIEAALEMRHLFHRIIVSTDDEAIAEMARRTGAEVPFLRPSHLAEDRTPTLPVLQHAVTFVESQDGIRLDLVCLLQPTTPLREPQDIVAAMQLAHADGCDSVISVTQVWDEHPIRMKRIENGRLLPYCIDEKEGTRRQDCSPPAYLKNGAIYITRRDVLMKRNSIWGDVIRPYVMPPERSVNVDSELDLKLADLLLRERNERAATYD